MGKRSSRGDLAGTGSEAGYYQPRNYWGSKVAPYGGQWAAMLIAWPAGALTHLMLADSPHLPWITPVLALAGTVLAGVAYKAAGTRSGITRVHATITVAILTGWLVTCAITAPWRQPLVGIWLFGGATLALSWNIRRALRGGEESGGAGALFEKVKLAGVQAKAIDVAPNKVTAPLALPPGEVSVEEVQGAVDKIASALRLPKGSVRVVGDPDDTSQATMTIVPVDVLRHPQPWRGPSAPGGSIAEPIVPGVYEDNELQRMFFPGDKATQRQAATWIVQGMKGSGKTGGAKNCWTEMLTRRDNNLIVLDPSKGEQSVAFLGDSTSVVIGHKQCQQVMSRVPDVITDRATSLGRWGFDEWTPEVFERHGMPYLVIWVEESTRVLEDAATMTRIAQECRSAGISVVFSLQKASFRQMSTDVRSQIDGVWCFGVKDIDDAAFTLSEQVIDAGARPDKWQNRRVGCNYVEGPGIDEDRLPIPGRTFTATDEERAQVIDAHAGIRPELWAPTAKILGLPAKPTSQQGGTVVPITAHTSSVTAALADDWDNGFLSDEDDRTLLALPDDPEPDLEDLDPDAELPDDDPDMVLPGGSRRGRRPGSGCAPRWTSSPATAAPRSPSATCPTPRPCSAAPASGCPASSRAWPATGCWRRPGPTARPSSTARAPVTQRDM
ncbi:hypothetical protein FXN61_46180 [Lentzea sp. PSKA42]|uniref:DNA segregation ATPase FtsK/SpoIIIE, S-DNA-T family n=1 Tax=Lentzea indica TaxID=2604800 RepID=A0ABX1FXC9_9PSEU|nr:hypothetical protein [Lentzea indica]NKE63713.1 hypothetical protein [Lentzea indica]